MREGHAGAALSDGPLETLTVVCCGESQIVILVTRSNQSFQQGPRRELLALLHKWREELTATAEQEWRKKR
jgi:hypothetical protein